MESIRMKVWMPDTDTIARMYTVSSNAHNLGNDVAEGRLAKEDYYKTLYQHTLRDFNHFVAGKVKEQKKREAKLYEREYISRLIAYMFPDE